MTMICKIFIDRTENIRKFHNISGIPLLAQKSTLEDETGIVYLQGYLTNEIYIIYGQIMPTLRERRAEAFF